MNGSFLSINPLYPFSGLLVGILVGLTGVGGGSLMTPLLVLLFRIHPVTAVGTDLLYAAATKTVGTFVHGLNHSVDWAITRRLAFGSLPATILTLALLSQFATHSQASGHAISLVLGVALLLTALSLVFRKQILAFGTARFGELPARRVELLTIATGAVLGAAVSVSSVGAGAIGVTALLLLYPRLPTARIIGSDIAHAVPLTLVAGTGHWLLGDVDWMLLGSLLLGSIPGVVLGSYLSARVPDLALRLALAATLAVVGSRLVV